MRNKIFSLLVLLMTAVTGAWAQEPDPINLTSTNGTEWTLASMPGCDVELEIKYCDYPAATLTAAPTAKTNLLFTGSALPLVDAGTAANGTLYYALGTADAAPTEESDWSTDLPTASGIGVYHVWYLVMGDATHNGIDPAGPLTVTVKADITAADVTAPTAVENLKYKGVPQALIVAGSVTGDIGTMQYRLGTDGTWSTDIPTATDKGDYTVYYKVVGDDLHNDYVPAGSIAVTIGEGAEMAAQLTVNGNTGTSCTAMLLDAATYQPLASGVKVGEKFILSTVKEDGYDFNVTGASTTEFTAEEYLAYYNYAKDNDIYVSLNTSLFWVTMPHVEGGTMDLAVNFQQLKTFTVLYKRTGSEAGVVGCKMARTVNGQEEVSYSLLQRGASMGDNAVWTMTMTSAFDPTKVAFYEAAVPQGQAETEAFANTLEGATMATATISESTDTWNTVTGGGEYLIIHGNVKVVTASFVADANAVTTMKDYTFDVATTKGGVTYQLAVCKTDAEGNVTEAGTVNPPAAPTAPEGKAFGGWRGYVYDGLGRATEKIYAAGATGITVRGNVTFSAVWNPVQVTTTFAMNGGTGTTTSATVNYGETLGDISTPTRQGFVLDRWTVAKAVTESGVVFGKGATFNMSTALTSNLSLTAQWKHVHEYTSYQISKFGDALKNYQKYNGYLHIAICGCDDVDIVEHEFNPAGKCACGYMKPSPTNVEVETFYGKKEGNTYTKFMDGMPEYPLRGSEVTIEAPHNWGDLEFKTWEYSTDGGTTWYELAAYEIVGFLAPCNMQARAIYVNPVQTPTVELTTSEYLQDTEYEGQTYKMGNILYQMSYKLPDGYKLLGGGIRMGDNSGISYYFKQTVKTSFDNESKGIIGAMGAGIAGLGMLTGGVDIMTLKDLGEGAFAEQYSTRYLETEENVMEKEKMTAATLAKKMMENTPVNVDKYPPIYWDATVPTRGMFGSACTLPPLRFAQKNNQDHYIYGVAYITYLTPNNETKTLYTDAVAATVNHPDCHVVKEAEQPSGAHMMTQQREAAATRRAPMREPSQQQPAEQVDMSSIMAPQTQLTVYVDGEYNASLSDTYGYGETISLTAPTVSGKSFSYWTADGSVVSNSTTLKMTINANTTLRAMYNADAATAAAAITSVSRTGDGTQINVQAIGNGTFDKAGIVYSTTAAEPVIGTEGVNNVEAVSYQNLSAQAEMPASILDKNNCWSLKITAESADAVYYVRAYATVGGNITYGDVKEVKLSSLKSGLMMVANLEAFEPGFDDALTEVQNSILILDEMTDNSEVLTERDGDEATVTLKRKLVAGSWNTLAVPFNVSSDMLDHLTSTYGMSVKQLAGTSLENDGKTLMLNFTDATEMVAGTPYLVKVSSDYDFSARALPNVEVSQELNPVQTDYADFIPTLGKTLVTGPEGNEDDAEAVLFVAANNTLKNPTVVNNPEQESSYMKGFRAYFQLKNLPAEARTFALNIGGEATSIISTTDNTDNTDSVYDLQGRKVDNAATKGVYIQNGRKVVVK